MSDEHLTPEQTAGYLDRTLSVSARETVEAHLAACPECRGEAVALRLLVGVPRSHRSMVGLVAGLAAAAVFLLVWPPGPQDPATHRAPDTGVQAPDPVLPRGPGQRPSGFHWRPLPGADRYRITLFDTAGSVLLQMESEDTFAVLPDSVSLGVGRPYHWKLEFADGSDGWSGSDLVTFEVTAPANGTAP
jgi:hypothetical protein